MFMDIIDYQTFSKNVQNNVIKWQVGVNKKTDYDKTSKIFNRKNNRKF